MLSSAAESWTAAPTVRTNPASEGWRCPSTTRTVAPMRENVVSPLAPGCKYTMRPSASFGEVAARSGDDPEEVAAEAAAEAL